MIFRVMCQVKGSRTPLYSPTFDTREAADANLLRWKQREDWEVLEIWNMSPPGKSSQGKPKRVHREERNKDG